MSYTDKGIWPHYTAKRVRLPSYAIELQLGVSDHGFHNS